MKIGNSKLSRRDAVAGSLMFPILAGLNSSVANAEGNVAGSGASALVAYMTRTGNTQVIAGQIRRALQADIFEITPRDAYPDDYEETVAQAHKERDSGYEPPLAGDLPGIARYETVFLGFPIWGMTAPPLIRSFLSAHGLSGKTLVPFITHGGYGTGESLTVVREKAPGAQILKAFVMEADQERRTLERVTGWLGQTRLPL